MQNKVIIPLLSGILMMLTVSCNFTSHEAASSQARDTKEVIAKSLVNLPCFKCHSYKDFKNNRNFPHDTHRSMGLHCNQCHIIKAHESMTLNSDTCNNCHNLTLMKLSLTNMPAEFNHEKHSGMFACKDCHKDMFRMKVNSVKITMKSINKGKFCGRCHNGRIAFPASKCTRCHSAG